MIMKKSLWMLGMAVTALTSCTQSEVLDVAESRVIGFNTHVDKTTRAIQPINGVGLESNDLNTFYVYAHEGSNDKFFEGISVTYDGAKFSYEPHKQWKAGTNYHFAAYSDGNDSVSDVNFVKISNGSQLNIDNYTVGDKDLLAAIVDPISINASANNTPDNVYFTFEHMLCAVTLNLTNEGANYLKIGEISLNAIKTSSCSYKIENGTKSCVWNSLATSENNAYTFPATADGTYIAPGLRHVVSLFFIPQSTDISVSIPVSTYTKTGDTYAMSSEETKTTTLKLTDNNGSTLSWQNGKHYVYNGSLAGTVHYIHFDATVTGWGDPVNNTLTFN